MRVDGWSPVGASTKTLLTAMAWVRPVVPGAHRELVHGVVPP